MSLNDFVFHNTPSITFTVSVFRMANLIHGNFSSFERNVAIETASIDSTNNASIFIPRECL